MKTANRGGHNHQSLGANGYVNEVTEDRKINTAVIKWSKKLGINANDVTPGNCNSDSDLVYGVQMANNVLNADIFNSNHLNAHITCKEAKGCECVTYGDAASVLIANRIRDNLVKLGFKHRENKVNKSLYEVKATVMPSVIVEPFFVDSYADVQNYYKVGADEIGRAIAYGIANKEFNINVIKEEEEMITFNEEFYLNTYKDIKDAVKKGAFKSGKEHYLKFGRQEKRLPIPQVPSSYNEGIYRLANSDVDKAIRNSDYNNGVEHFVQFGYKENRLFGLPEGFSEEKYKVLNPDVASAIKSGEIKSCVDHYCMYGYKENRKYK